MSSLMSVLFYRNNEPKTYREAFDRLSNFVHKGILDEGILPRHVVIDTISVYRDNESDYECLWAFAREVIGYPVPRKALIPILEKMQFGMRTSITKEEVTTYWTEVAKRLNKYAVWP